MNRAQSRLRLRRLTVWMAAAGCIAAPALAQTTHIIGDNTGPVVVTVPPDVLPAFNNLILGNEIGRAHV